VALLFNAAGQDETMAVFIYFLDGIHALRLLPPLGAEIFPAASPSHPVSADSIPRR
jgi:hypothetical protein